MDRERFLDEFAQLAQHVQAEADTLAYEVAVADNSPNKVVIYERCGWRVGQITCAVSSSLRCRRLANERSCSCRQALPCSCRAHYQHWNTACAACRYASKAALVDVHQKSPAYARFKEATAGLEFKEKTGQSYYEADLGFVPS